MSNSWGPALIKSYGVLERRFYQRGNLTLCGGFDVPSGSEITSEKGCFTLGDVQRYYAQVVVENPSEEALTYDWLLNVYGTEDVYRSYSLPGSTSNTWDLRFGSGNTAYGPLRCTVSVRVNAPDASRSKSVTVWTGNCAANWVYIG